MSDFTTITTAIDGYLHSVLPSQAATLIECALVAVCAIAAYLTFAIVMIFM